MVVTLKAFVVSVVMATGLSACKQSEHVSVICLVKSQVLVLTCAELFFFFDVDVKRRRTL